MKPFVDPEICVLPFVIGDTLASDVISGVLLPTDGEWE